MQYAGNCLIQQFQVVANHQQCSAIVAQKSKQPRLCVNIQVVGWFVQQQGVASCKQNARQLHTPALATRQHAQLRTQSVAFQPKPGGNRSRFTLCRITALGRKLVFGFRELGNVLWCCRRFHCSAQLFYARKVFINLSSRQHVRNSRQCFTRTRDFWVLRQITEATFSQHLAKVRLYCATQHLEQTCFPRAVAAYKACFVARHHGERCILHHHLSANLNGETLDL